MLEDWAGQLLGLLPKSEDDDALVLTPDTLPEPEDTSTEGMVIRKGTHVFLSTPLDRLWCYTERDTAASLGLLILASILHGSEDNVEVRLSRPGSTVKRILLDTEAVRHAPGARKLTVTPTSFEYLDAQVSRHPLGHVPEYALPEVRLTNEMDAVWSANDVEQRDTVMGFGNLSGAAHFAQMLLDLSRPANTQTEVDLEPPPGFGGLAAGSAWMRIILPEDPDWPPDLTTAVEPRSGTAGPIPT